MKYHKDKKKKKGIDKFIEGHNRRLMSSFSNNKITNNDSLVGNKISIKIESIGSKGDGIARYNTDTVIVPNTKVGDNVKVRITGVRGKLIFGELSKKKLINNVSM